MTQSITLSSVGTATLVLNPVAKATTVMVSASVQSSLSTVTVEMSLDDPSAPGAATTTWVALSSATAMSSFSGGYVYSVLSPMAQVRLNSTAMTASSATFTLKALQAVTA